jgi:hypothetical protein
MHVFRSTGSNALLGAYLARFLHSFPDEMPSGLSPAEFVIINHFVF